MVKIGIELSDRKIRFLTGFLLILLLLNVLIFLLPNLLPPANFTISHNTSPIQLYNGDLDAQQQIRYSKHFIYILEARDQILYKIGVDDHSSTSINLADILDRERLSGVMLTNVNDQGVYLSHFSRDSPGIEYYFSYIEGDTLGYSYPISNEIDRDNFVDLYWPRAASFSLDNYELLVQLEYEQKCQISFISISQGYGITHMNTLDMGDYSENSCDDVGTVSLHQNKIIITGAFLNGHRNMYQYDPSTQIFREYEPYTQFSEQRESQFSQQENTYYYHGFFFIGDTIYFLAIWNELYFGDSSQRPPRYLDILDSNHDLIYRHNLYDLVENRTDFGTIYHKYWFTSTYYGQLSSSFELLPLQTGKLGNSIHVFGFN